MTSKNLDLASVLVNRLINEIIENYGSSKDHLVRRIEDNDGITVQPTYSTVFYCYTDFVKIADATGCHTYLTIEDNLNGQPTPTLCIF